MQPSRMSEDEFVATFGDIFEHTPQIARQAHQRGLSAAQDTASGLHERLVAIMRDMDRGAKLALINAHPDLAGRLALAKELTADSTKEQGSAGLDKLTPDCREASKKMREKVDEVKDAAKKSREACRDDFFKLCQGVPLDDDERRACLIRHKRQLSEACAKSLR